MRPGSTRRRRRGAPFDVNRALTVAEGPARLWRMGTLLPGQSDTEAPELGDMLARMLRALVRRAAAGELDAVIELSLLEQRAGDALVLAARGAHGEPGRYSWTEIGRELGITRQAAQQRFGADDPEQ